MTTTYAVRNDMPEAPVSWRFRCCHRTDGRIGWSMDRIDRRKRPDRGGPPAGAPVGGGYVASLDEALTKASAIAGGPLTVITVTS